MHRYKDYLTVSDLDGTLINSNQEISQKNIEAISGYIEEGGLFAVATGRTELNALPFIGNVPINCPCILYNGAMIYDFEKKQVVQCTYLDSTELMETLKYILQEFKDVCLQIFTEGRIFIVSSEDTIDPVVTNEKQPFELASLEEIPREKWIKILINYSNETLKIIEQILHTRVKAEIFDSVFSTSIYLEILPYGVSKGSALARLMEIMKVKREKVAAIGDYCNDIEMIQTAGLGVATANAHPLVKDAADIVTVSNDEDAIDYLINMEIPKFEQAGFKDRGKTLWPANGAKGNISL